MNEHLEAVQDAAWNMKETCDDLAPRKLSERDVVTLQSVLRDLARLQAKLVGIRDKYKRGSKGEDEPAAAQAPSEQVDNAPDSAPASANGAANV